MASRIEHYYFIRTGFILGMFTTSPKVAQHLAAQRKDITGAKRVMDYLKSLDRGVILPAIYLKENRDQGHDNQILRQLGTECSGVIPETGIFIGDVKNRPPRDVKPRLVYQSPR